MNDLIIKEYPFHLHFGTVIIFTLLAYLFVQAGVFAQEGKISEANLLNTASNAFLTMVIAAYLVLILLKIGLFEQVKILGEFGENATTNMAIGIVIGLVFWTALLSFSNFQGTQSVFQLNPNFSVFAQAGVALPEFWSSFIINFAAPYAEELAFTVGLPLVGFVFLHYMSKITGLSFFDNPFVQIALVVGITAITFSFFHVSQQAVFPFIVSAILFRTIIFVLVSGDVFFDFVPFATIALGFALGIHHANNILSTGGYLKFFSVMAQGAGDLFSLMWGWLIILYFVSAFFITFKFGLERLDVI